MNKPQLRENFKKQRDNSVFSMNISDREAAFRAVADHLKPPIIAAEDIGGYAAMTSELDPTSALADLRRSGHRISLPYFAERNETMIFREWHGELEKGPFGIRQPPKNTAIAEPALLLMPLVAADLSGNRLGQGQGHYDRYLEKMTKIQTIVTIGLAWECQIAEAIPADPWDQPLDYICTPERLIETTS